jgi:PHD/YefM family antitoxin component YafN of YafNO toxin-antitoxin module
MNAIGYKVTRANLANIMARVCSDQTLIIITGKQYTKKAKAY